MPELLNNDWTMHADAYRQACSCAQADSTIAAQLQTQMQVRFNSILIAFLHMQMQDHVCFVAGMLPCLADGAVRGKSETLYNLTGTTGSLMYMAPEVSMTAQSPGLQCLLMLFMQVHADMACDKLYILDDRAWR